MNASTNQSEQDLLALGNEGASSAAWLKFKILSVIFLDCMALVVYLDLVMVIKRKKHLFTILFEKKVIAQKQLSPYANAYYASLKRDWFCVLDKVAISEVPGLKKLGTGTLVDLIILATLAQIGLSLLDLMSFSTSIIRHTMPPQPADLAPASEDGEVIQKISKTTRGVSISSIQFAFQFWTYYIVLLFSLVSYQSFKRELCFHCKWGYFALQTLSILVLTFGILEAMPWGQFTFAFILLCLVIFVRATNKEERRKLAEKRRQVYERKVQEEKMRQQQRATIQEEEDSGSDGQDQNEEVELQRY